MVHLTEAMAKPCTSFVPTAKKLKRKSIAITKPGVTFQTARRNIPDDPQSARVERTAAS